MCLAYLKVGSSLHKSEGIHLQSRREGHLLNRLLAHFQGSTSILCATEFRGRVSDPFRLATEL